METITFHFTPASADYSQAGLESKSQGEKFSAYIIFGVLLVLLLLTLIFYREPGSLQTTYLYILGGFVFFVFVIYGPIQYQKRFHDNPQLTMPATWEISEQGVTITNALTQVQRDWVSFREARETKNYFLLIDAVNPKQYLFLNKKAFESAGQMDAFRAALRQTVGLSAEQKR